MVSCLSEDIPLCGIKVYKHKLLPCSKEEAMCIPKHKGVSREFWVNEECGVWGFIEKTEFGAKMFLSEKAFERFKNYELENEDSAHRKIRGKYVS